MTTDSGASGAVTITSQPGWWPSLVAVSCSACGWFERVNLNAAPLHYADRLAGRHRCVECCHDGPAGHTEQEHHDASPCFDLSCRFDHPHGGPFASGEQEAQR